MRGWRSLPLVALSLWLGCAKSPAVVAGPNCPVMPIEMMDELEEHLPSMPATEAWLGRMVVHCEAVANAEGR
jgi:hypothetical protein